MRGQNELVRDLVKKVSRGLWKFATPKNAPNVISLLMAY